jgi:aspartyl-tRNA(Asn)/glutamyl-tRNA(Gln) amidotransferase subunit A
MSAQPLMTRPAATAPQGLAQLSQALRAGILTSQALTQAVLSRVAQMEPRLSAFTHLDAERALRHAQAIDQLRASGIDLGPLMGLPIAVKDLFTIDGMPTMAGSRLNIQDLVPAQGSFVAALNRAGCVVLGKTRTSEFAMGGYNPSHPLPWNPCDAEVRRMTGGSSHGSAVAMAAALAAFTVGSDTGGSVRWPAALCGVVGYKSSGTHWPCDGVFPMSPHMDSLGIFTQSALDAAWVEAALAQRAPLPPPPVQGLTLGLPKHHFHEQCDAEVLSCFHAALDRLQRAGAQVVEIDVPEVAEIDEVFRCLVPADVLATLGRERVMAHWDLLDPVAAQRLQAGLHVMADAYAGMVSRRRSVEAAVQARSAGIDAWITPTVPMLPGPVADYTTVDDIAAWNRRATRNTRPANLFNRCGISLPIQHLGAHLPVGLQLCAPAGDDAGLLACAVSVQTLLGAPPQPPIWVG